MAHGIGSAGAGRGPAVCVRIVNPPPGIGFAVIISWTIDVAINEGAISVMLHKPKLHTPSPTHVESPEIPVIRLFEQLNLLRIVHPVTSSVPDIEQLSQPRPCRKGQLESPISAVIGLFPHLKSFRLLKLLTSRRPEIEQ